MLHQHLPVNPISPKKTYSTPILQSATVPVQARRNASQYMETSGPAVRDNTRVGTNLVVTIRR
jgi:hypothetical protein